MIEDEFDGDVPADEHEALLTIAHGAFVTSGGVSLQRALSAVTTFVLTQGLGAVGYGVYALAWRITQLLIRFVNFGTVSTLQRYIPAYGGASGKREHVAGLAYLTTAGVGVAIGTGLFLAAEWIDAVTLSHPSFAPTIRIFAALIGLVGFVNVHAAMFRAVESARGEVAFNRVFRPTVRLVGAAGALALGYSVVGVAGALLVGTGLLVIVGFQVSVSVTGIRPALRGSRSEVRRFYDHAAPVALSSVGKVFQNRVDVLLIGALLTATAAGVYNVVLVLVSITWIPLVAFNQLMPPVASDLYANGRNGLLDAVYTSVTRLVLTATLPVLSIQLVYGRELLSTFGSAYVSGYSPLVIYLGGVLVGCAVGSTGWLLMMTDHQYAKMSLDWFLAGANVVLTYVFVLEFGLAGAALGTATAIGVQNSLQVLLLRRLEGLWPFDATFLKPLAAATAMVAVMAGVREALPGFTAVGVGVLVGGATFVVTLVALGVDDHDRLLARELASRYVGRFSRPNRGDR